MILPVLLCRKLAAAASTLQAITAALPWARQLRKVTSIELNSKEIYLVELSGPTDLSVKRPLLPHNLNLTEAVAVKSLITGYREAAAFLLRSADELEQLLLNQPQ